MNFLKIRGKCANGGLKYPALLRLNGRGVNSVFWPVENAPNVTGWGRFGQGGGGSGFVDLRPAHPGFQDRDLFDRIRINLTGIRPEPLRFSASLVWSVLLEECCCVMGNYSRARVALYR